MSIPDLRYYSNKTKEKKGDYIDMYSSKELKEWLSYYSSTTDRQLINY